MEEADACHVSRSFFGEAGPVVGSLTPAPLDYKLVCLHPCSSRNRNGSTVARTKLQRHCEIGGVSKLDRRSRPKRSWKLCTPVATTDISSKLRLAMIVLVPGGRRMLQSWCRASRRPVWALFCLANCCTEQAVFDTAGLSHNSPHSCNAYVLERG